MPQWKLALSRDSQKTLHFLTGQTSLLDPAARSPLEALVKELCALLDQSEILPHGRWREALNDREAQEVALSGVYVKDFNHGTPGHNHYTLIAKLAELLDALSMMNTSPPTGG